MSSAAPNLRAHPRPRTRIAICRPESPAADENPAGWSADDLAPHKIGGSLGRRIVDVIFITIIIVIGAFAYAVTQSGGIWDFDRFDHMIDVATAGKKFEPRPEWIPPPPPPPKPVVVEPLRAKGGFAMLFRVGKGRKAKPALLIKGRIVNVAEADYTSVKLLVVVYDAAGEVFAQKETQPGLNLKRSDVSGITAEELPGLMEFEAKGVSPAGYAPFSVVFDEFPETVTKEFELSYEVKIIESKSSGDNSAEEKAAK